MQNDIGVFRALFLKAYASVPEKLRGEIIALVDGKSYSWDSAYLEVNGKTPLGDRIIRTLEEIGLFEKR